MRRAIIENGIVENIVLGGKKGVECDASVKIGWFYDGSTFSAPPPTPLTDAQQAFFDIQKLEAETNSARFQRELRHAPDTQYKSTGKTVIEYDAWAFSEIERLRGLL